MSTRQIIAELPRLTVAELRAVGQRIAELASRQTTDAARGRTHRGTPYTRRPARRPSGRRSRPSLTSFRDLAAAPLAPGSPAPRQNLSFPAQKRRCQVLNLATRAESALQDVRDKCRV